MTDTTRLSSREASAQTSSAHRSRASSLSSLTCWVGWSELGYQKEGQAAREGFMTSDNQYSRCQWLLMQPHVPVQSQAVQS